MRRAAVVFIGAALLSSAAGASAEGSGRPTLKLKGTEPLSVQGLRFAPRERVHVRVRAAEERATKRVVAGARGTFIATFPTLELDRCNGLLVTATGSNGSEATLRRADLQCPPKL